MTPVALTIAGSDPSGGAGLQADLKTFHQFGVYGMSVVTLLTVQNTRAVTAVERLDAELVRQQLAAVLEDIPPAAAKTGALGSTAVIRMVAEQARDFAFPLVVDPVMISKHGAPLLDDAAAAALREHLLPRAFLVTPNVHEAAALTGLTLRSVDDLERAARALAARGPRHVLVKGGALGDEAVDVLVSDGVCRRLAAPRLDSRALHGTGCVLAAAITAGLAAGQDVAAAITAAKAFVTAAIRTAPGLGGGLGPVNMHAERTAP
jgi:hydroxymethylpyrimidine/phosphomethylpyrimidine kinase